MDLRTSKELKEESNISKEESNEEITKEESNEEITKEESNEEITKESNQDFQFQILSHLKALNEDNIVSLNLSIDNSKKLRAQEARVLADSIKVNSSCLFLNLSNNLIENEGAMYIFESLTHNFVLTSVSLENNSLDDKCLNFILESVSKSPCLETLEIEKGNKFTKTEQLKTLKKLLEYNSEHSLIYENSTNLMSAWGELKKIISFREGLQVLRLQKCNLTHFPSPLEELASLKVLDLANNFFESIPKLDYLKNLKFLNLTNNRINFLTIINWQLPSSLEKICLHGNQTIDLNTRKSFSEALQMLYQPEFNETVRDLTKILLCISFRNQFFLPNTVKLADDLISLRKIWEETLKPAPIPKELKQITLFTLLDLSCANLTKFPECVSYCFWLQHIQLQKNSITNLPEDIKFLTSLTELNLESNPIEEFPKNLQFSTTLKRLWMDYTLVSYVLPCSLENIQRFSISSQLSSIENIVNWTLLEFLFLNNNKLMILPSSIKQLQQLRKLHLNENQLETLPEEIGDLKFLEYLEVKNNNLSKLPTRIGELGRLRSLNLYNNKLTNFPPSFAFLTKLQDLNIRKNPLSLTISQNESDLTFIRNHFNNILTGQRKCNYVKMTVVGEENIGKTSLIRALIAYSTRTFLRKSGVEAVFNTRNLSTDGIVVQSLEVSVPKQYGLPNNQLIFNIWDFGGQDIYYSTHAFFLSENSLYVIVWNISKPKEKERVGYWYRTIQSIAPRSSILLVGTHLDEAQLLCLNIEEKCKDMAELFELDIQDIIPLSNKTGANFEIFFKRIVEKGVKLPLVNTLFPKMYSDLKELIDQAAKEFSPPIINLEEFKNIARKSNIVGPELIKATNFLHTLGFCLHFSKDPLLKNYIVLNPQWFATILASLVSTRTEFIQRNGGILDHKHLKAVWQNYPSNIHQLLLKLMEKFYVSIPITNSGPNIYEGQSVVPALLSSKAPEELLDQWNFQENRCKRFYKFLRFFPPDLFPRLVASMIVLLGIHKTKFWKNGILIVREDSKALLTVNATDRGVGILFSGTDWFFLFKRIKSTLDMLLQKWNGLDISIYITCSACLSKNQNKFNENFFETDYCFEWKECIECFSERKDSIFCKKSLVDVKLVDVLPELFRSGIKIIDSDQVNLGEKVGEGGFAIVYKGKYNDQNVAIKVLKINPLESEEKELREFLQEMELFTNEAHPNLIQALAVVLSPCWLITPLAAYGSLYDNLIDPNKAWKWPLPLRVAFDISNGMNYLHSLDPPILHCDLRSPNVLLFSLQFEDKIVAKIADFGISQYYLGRVLLKDKRGLNPAWTAPEILNNEGLTTFSDVYSFGMVLYEMLTRQIPFHENKYKFRHVVEDEVKEGKRPRFSKKEINAAFQTEIPTKIYHILQACWRQSPIKRPSFNVVSATLKDLIEPLWPGINQVYKVANLNIPSKSPQTLQWNLRKLSTYSEIKPIRELKASEYSKTYTCFVEGSYSQVFVGKEIKLVHSPDVPTFVNQLRVLVKGPHPNLTSLLAYYYDKSIIVLIVEHFEGGSLDSILWRRYVNGDNFSAKELIFYSSEITNGLKYLHEIKLPHRNLKCSNIMVKLKDISTIQSLHLSDFGNVSLSVNQESNWKAPELFGNGEEDLYLADIWSFGIVIYELVGGVFPKQFNPKEKLKWPISQTPELINPNLTPSQTRKEERYSPPPKSSPEQSPRESVVSSYNNFPDPISKEAFEQLHQIFETCTNLEPILRPTSKNIYDKLMYQLSLLNNNNST